MENNPPDTFHYFTGLRVPFGPFPAESYARWSWTPGAAMPDTTQQLGDGNVTKPPEN